MPSAPPNCLAVVFRPLALANMAGGADIAAAAEVAVVVAPMPTPASRDAGSHSVTKAGAAVRAKISQAQQEPSASRPNSVANLGPPSRGASRPTASAAMDADTAPGVLARPACSSEKCQAPVM